MGSNGGREITPKLNWLIFVHKLIKQKNGVLIFPYKSRFSKFVVIFPNKTPQIKFLAMLRNTSNLAV